ncbi:hypothetical protein HQ576_09325 [bacterium]|nr:hypothetical protein [bacterium]
MRTFWLAALVALLAMPALAGEKGEKKGGGKGEKVTGQFVSAALEGGQITWKITAEDGAEKAYTMASEVVVMYSERNGVNRAMGIGAKGKKVREAKGNRLVATGTFVSAAAEGNKVNVAVTVDGAEKTFVLGTKLTVLARERKGQTTAMRIMSAGGGKKKGDDADKPKKGKRKKEGDAPPNI